MIQQFLLYICCASGFVHINSRAPQNYFPLRKVSTFVLDMVSGGVFLSVYIYTLFGVIFITCLSGFLTPYSAISGARVTWSERWIFLH